MWQVGVGQGGSLTLVNSHSKPVRQALLLISFYRIGKIQLREAKKLAKVSQHGGTFVLWPRRYYDYCKGPFCYQDSYYSNLFAREEQHGIYLHSNNINIQSSLLKLRHWFESYGGRFQILHFRNKIKQVCIEYLLCEYQQQLILSTYQVAEMEFKSRQFDTSKQIIE